MEKLDSRLKLAIQKPGGKLYEDTDRMLKDCGLSYISPNNGQLSIALNNFPADLMISRDDDIPQRTAKGITDLGIVGQNLIEEYNPRVVTLRRLGFGKCRFVLAVSENSDYKQVFDLKDLRVATSYPRVAKTYFDQRDVKTKIIKLSGGVEAAIENKEAEAIIDLSQSGKSLKDNNLRIIDTIAESEAILIASEKALKDKGKMKIINNLLFRIDGILRAREFYYVVLNAKKGTGKEIALQIPGLKSPTILDLADPNWEAVHIALSKESIWDNISKLKNAGGEGIMVFEPKVVVP